jgi:hypothetical protein
MTPERPAHDEDCEQVSSSHRYEVWCACSYRASLVKLEREREEDRAAIRDAMEWLVMAPRDGHPMTFSELATSEMRRKHAAAIQRATNA